MENEHNVNGAENSNESSGTTYHFGRNESPFGREDISGKSTYESGAVYHDTNASANTEEQVRKTEDGNPYNQGSVYGQGIYTGNDFAKSEPVPDTKKEKKAAKKSSGKVKKAAGFIGAAAAFGLIAGGVMVGVNAAGNKLMGINKSNTQLATVATTDSIQGNREENASGYADVADEVMPSLVSITNTSVQKVRSWFQSYEQEVQGSGSGIIIGQTDDEILIATNNHVIDGAKEITVAFNDKTASSAVVKGADSVADLAVVAVKVSDMEKETLANIKIAALGSSDTLRVGEPVIAIGNALGYGQSFSAGYISALDREVDVENNNTMHLLQTDAAINPGNSGGALFNTKGEVIGINTVKYVDSSVEGMGYAIPISTAIPIVNDLMNQEIIEESEQGYLGIQGKAITDEYAENLNMPKGVYVVKIVEDSPADRCGLKAGDIITKFSGRDVNSMEALQQILTGKKAGEEVEMIVQRNTEKGEYEEATLTVKLGAKKDMPDNAVSEQQDKQETGNDGDEYDPSDDYYRRGEQITPDDFFNFFGY